jgi:MFS family permease
MIAALAVLALSRDLALWFLARFVLGLGVNGLYVLSETWLNLLVPKAQRGRWLAIYATSLAAGFALGPMLLLATGTDGVAPFAATIAITAATAGLVAVAAPRLPPVRFQHGQSMRGFLPLAPLLLLAVGGAAAFDQAVLTFLPIWTLEIGGSTTAAQLAITALALGNVALQWPLGWLADRVSRRAAMLACTTATALGALLLPLVDGGGWALWTLVFLWGGFAYGTYTVALIELGDRFTGGLLLAGNAAFAMMWGVAGLVGPSAVGAAMDLAGPVGLPLVLGVMFTAIGLAFWRRPRLDNATVIT